MADRDDLHLFQGLGVEIEYMIVDADDLAIRPVCDELLADVAGPQANEHCAGLVSWSNELARHVVELKTTDPAPHCAGLSAAFQTEIEDIARRLATIGCRLLPGAMHPWMDPGREFELFPHGEHAIYESFDRIFGCRHHGWANLQSVHINLPFQGDDEFGRLHAAIRLLLPLIPALSAGSPYADGRATADLDHRLTVYRNNCARIPSITGQVIPEPIFRIGEYHDLLASLYRDIAPHDPAGILQDEWLNARGAIARFDRNCIEIRVIDSQECIAADLAIVEIVVAAVRALVGEELCDSKSQRDYAQRDLLRLFDLTVAQGDLASIGSGAYLRLFGVRDSSQLSAGQLWGRLIEFAAGAGQLSAEAELQAEDYLRRGCLARRLREIGGLNPSADQLRDLYRRLADCLPANQRL